VTGERRRDSHDDTGYHILGFPNENVLHENTDQDNSSQKYRETIIINYKLYTYGCNKPNSL